MKKIYKTLFLLILNSAFGIHNSFSQTAPGIEWQKCYGGTSNDGAWDFCQTFDSGFLLAGHASNNSGNITGHHGSSDFWLTKLDSNGMLLWQKCYGGTDSEIAYSIIQTADSGYAVAGWTASNDYDVTINNGGSDFWVLKVDSIGTIQWEKSLGGSAGDQAYSIVQTTDGGYAVAGYTASNDSDVTGNHGLGSDYWLVKLNGSGLMQWQKCYGGSLADQACAAVQTLDGGYAIGGWSRSNDSNVTGHHGSTFQKDYWIVKTDSAGNLQWEKSLGGTDDDMAFSLIQTTDNGYTVAGTSYSNDFDVTGHIGPITESDYWIVKLDSSGTIEWEKSLGGTSNDAAYSIIQTLDNGYALTGYTSSNDIYVSGLNGNFDFWTIKLDTIGIIQWQKCLGGSNNDQGKSIIQTSDAGYAVAGWTYSNDSVVSGNHGGSDYWIVKLYPDTITSITEAAGENAGFEVYPNPFENEFTVYVGSASSPHSLQFPAELKMFDVFGKEILSQQLTTVNSKLQTANLPPGIYFVKVDSVVKKVVKVE